MPRKKSTLSDRPLWNMRDLFTWYCYNALRIEQSFNHLSKKSSDLLLVSKLSSQMIVKMMKVMMLVKNDNWKKSTRLPADLSAQQMPTTESWSLGNCPLQGW
ncbi:hypothetical protein KQX54_011012 [Cotesia glomerata]|uniref:Uncharacterized protein n=1 Tax=Cotesia glomerata TaxID=32391 RepID=A0AAV7IQT8_COTGL|nr:hypothetical protein KQX54_011012 [Cotesia glomerata]